MIKGNCPSLMVVKGRKTALVQPEVYVQPDTGRGLGGVRVTRSTVYRRVCIVQAGEGAGLPSVLLEEGVCAQISGIQVTHFFLCLPVSEQLETGLLALLSLIRVQMWKRIRHSHEHRQRQTQGEPRGQNHHASGA